MNVAVLAQAKSHDQAQRDKLKSIIRDKSLLRGDFDLASGAKSSLYFEMKQTLLDPEGISLAAAAMLEELERFPTVTAIGGLELGACPVVTAVCQIWRAEFSGILRSERTKDPGGQTTGRWSGQGRG